MNGQIVEVPDPVHALDGIRAADTILKQRGIKKEAFNDMYAFLSELCHPNFLGLTFSENISDVGVITFQDHRKTFDENAGQIFNILTISLSVFFEVYKEVLELLQKNEELPPKA